MTTLTTLALVGALPLILIAAATGITAAGIASWWLWNHHQEEAFWERRVEAESRAVLDRIARGEERTYTADEVREMLRREREGPNS